MNIAELRGNHVIVFESKKQYSFSPNTELFTYHNYITLSCSFEDAKRNAEAIKKAMCFIEKSNMCAGAVVRECKV